MAGPDKHALVARLEILHGLLQHALLRSHAEGLRFASFTLNRLMQQPGTNLGEATKKAARELKEGLDAAGFGA